MFLVVSRLVSNPYLSLYDSSPSHVYRVKTGYTHFIMDHFHIKQIYMETIVNIHFIFPFRLTPTAKQNIP